MTTKKTFMSPPLKVKPDDNSKELKYTQSELTALKLADILATIKKPNNSMEKT
jgi:hypothetical protein